jgi:phosphoketolase
VVVLASLGDLILGPVFDAAQMLERAGARVRIVGIVNPRRLYRKEDVAVDAIPPSASPDEAFMTDAEFEAQFGGDVLVAISGGASAMLEPVLLRARQTRRACLCWRRGDTGANAAALFALNRLDAASIKGQVDRLLASAP